MNSNPNVFASKKVFTPRNAFPLSRRDMFTRPIGLITPIFFQDLSAGDYLKLNVRHFARTNNLQTSAFTQISEHVDFYFIPYRLVYQWFDQIITNTSSYDTSLDPNSGAAITGLPYITGDDIYQVLNLIVSGSGGTAVPDIFGYPVAQTFFRFMQMSGLPCRAKLTDTRDDLYKATTGRYNTTHFSPIRLYAFFRLYRDFYRDSNWETIPATYFNLDKYAAGSHIPAADLIAAVQAILGVCYKNMTKDFNTGLLPTTLLPQTDFPSFPSLNKEEFISLSHLDSNASYTSLYSTSLGQNASISAMAIRSLSAVEKLAQVARLSPQTYKGQMEAIFGVSPDMCDHCSPKYIGTYDSRIMINDVTATANGNNGADDISNVLGQVSGKGLSMDSEGNFVYQSSEHGLVIGVHSSDIDTVYNDDVLDIFNTKLTKSDFYNPVYDQLGMQAHTTAQSGLVGSATNVQGWQARYIEYKTAISKVHGEFSSSASAGISGSLNNWCCPYKSLTSVFSPAFYKINPATASNIFLRLYNGQPENDHLWEHYSFNVTKVADMSVYGLPILN